MTVAMIQKVQMVERYISDFKEAISTKNQDKCKQLIHLVVSVYENEIDDIRRGLDSYGDGFERGTSREDVINDGIILQAKLENYKLNLQSGLHRVLRRNENSVNVIQSAQQTMQNSIVITLEQTLADVYGLPETVLTTDEKEHLCGKLATLSAEKNKKIRWEKAQKILKWVADKSIELGKVALPYILQAIQNT